MDTNEVVGIIARDNLVRKIIDKVTDSGKTAADPTSLGDLENDIYLSLLEDEKIVGIYEQGHANYYIARIVINNICSSSSRYYRNYLMGLKKNVELNEALKLDNGGPEYYD